MFIEKVLKISLEKEEKEKILEVSGMLHEICINCDECENCPIVKLCNPIGTCPHTVLEELVKTLDK